MYSLVFGLSRAHRGIEALLRVHRRHLPYPFAARPPRLLFPLFLPQLLFPSFRALFHALFTFPNEFRMLMKVR